MIERRLVLMAVALSIPAFGLAACQRGAATLSEEPASRGLGWTEETRFCGGIAARPCPDGLVCEDDPTDGCDPAAGGADCGGVCVADDAECVTPGREYISRDSDVCAAVRYTCARMLIAFSDECGCGCEMVPLTGKTCDPSWCCAR
jgi:hypothetical protein